MYECDSCGNIYEIKLMKKGEDYNDFGYRYCPFCGTMFDIFIIPKRPKETANRNDNFGSTEENF